MLKKPVIYVLIIAMMLCWLPSIAVPVSAATGYDRGYDGGMAGDGRIYAHGIDVSSWQGSSLDFQNIKNAGYSYVILRVGTSYGKDECFETFYIKAKAAGLNVGVYYYSYATTTSAAYTDASNVLSWLSGKKFEYPIYFDYEDSSQSGISGQTSSEICYAFMDTLKNAGYLVGMYSMASWIEQSWVTTYGIRDTYEGWVAHYPTFDSNTGITSNVYNTYNSTYNTKYGMYQYSSTTYVNGAGPFDANIAYKDYPSIVSKYGFNGYTANSSSSSTTQSYKLTCSSYISNATARNYIDKMMNYYINNYSTLKSTLAAGQAVVFMFEGGSDNYWTGSDYVNSVWDVRIQAVAIVVKQDSNGDPYIAFCSEDCSSIPSYAPNCTAGVGYSGSVTILDGIYRMYRWDHTGPYAAFQLDIPNSNANGYGLYVPDSVPDGQLLGCSGINVHTRSTTSGSYWSEGCQLIGTGNDSSNAFNAFFRAVTGINATPWISWSPKSLYTWNGLGYYYGSSYTVGYFVVDRQLGMLGMDGTKYGTGSLNSIYNTTALGKLTSFSTSAAQAAGALNFDYVSTNCTYYPAHCKITVTRDQAPVNSEPCSIGTTTSNKTVEYAPAGTTYTATGLFKNGYGNYWYRVISNTGETAYIYGGEAYYVEELTSDITISGYSAPNGHVAGSYFYLTGNITSEYNQLNSASVYVHSGFGTSGSKMTGASASISGNSFNLSGSAIDSDTEFDKISTGQYTYAVSVNYTNYYAEGATTLKENTKTIYLRQDYFMVIPSSVSQSSCSHSYTTTNMGSGNCLNSLTIVKSCSTCGHITTTASSGAHTFSDWTTVNATCTSAGYKSRTCSVCGTQEKETYAALGHNYTKKVIEATCVSHMRYEYTCSNCGDTYVQDTGSLSGQWLESIPEGMDASLFNTKTQYRYSDLETTTSTSSSLSGYTQTGSSWVQTGTGSVQYVANWSSGFYTLSSLYAQYNKKSSKVTAYENETTKRVINSDAITGYLYFHWCTYGSYYSYEYPSSTYNLFDAYYSTTSPWNYDCDYNDMSYNTKVTTCSNSTWYFVDEVYTQKYTDYTKQYTYQRWGDYGAWSDTAVSASSTRQVQTRTLYQLKATNLGDHSWNSGSITTAAGCTTAGVKTYSCSLCGTSKTESVPALGHSYNAVVTAPTCTAAGYTTCTCANCGDSYVTDQVAANGHNWANATCTTAKTCSVCGTAEGDALGHNYSAVVTAPTCTTNGYTTYTCATCGDTYVADEVTATGHSFSDATCTDAPVCGICGTIEGNALGHNWTEATCTTAKTCGVCGAVEGEALGHDYRATVTSAGCTTQGYTTHTCSRCGDSYVDSYVDATGHAWDSKFGYCEKCGIDCIHEWDDGVITREPSCTNTGKFTYTCTVCGGTKADTLPNTGHSFVMYHVGATCTGQSYTVYQCENCDTNYSVPYGEPLGHDHIGSVTQEATCTENGVMTYCCSRCSDSYTESIEALGHSYNAVVTAPDCVNGGYTTYTCATCGDNYVSDEVGANGHNYEAVVTAPTCTTAGFTTYTCATCGDNYVSDEVAALGHSFSDATCTDASVCGICGATEGEALGHSYEAVVTAPTCTTAGYTTYTCACGDTYVADEMTATGHSYNAVVTAPTCIEAGYTTYTCATCGDTYVSDEVIASGHSYSSVTLEPTCTETGAVTYTCANCGDSYVVEIAALGHNYEAVVTAPTCADSGYTTYSCHCGDTYIADRVSALGHSYNAVVTAPTCTESGYTTYTCHCGNTYIANRISALGHSYNTAVTAPTCTEAGYTTYTCDGCGDSYVADRVSALGHSFSDATCTDAPVCGICGATEGEANGHNYNAVVTAPTCGAAGYTTYTCSVCGDSYVADEVAATGAHSYGYSFVNGCHTLTCSVCGDVISVAGTKALAFKNATLSLSSDISVIFKLDIDDVFEIGYMVFEVNGEETYVYDWTIDESNTSSKGRKVFTYQGINPQMMGDSINCTIHAYLNGTEVTVSYNDYSVLKYCTSQFAKTDAKVSQVCANLLEYGAAVQMKKGYKTDALVNANMPVDAETFPGVDAITNKQAMSGAAIGTTDIKSVALQLSSKVEIKVGMVLDNPADYVIKVTIKGNEFTYGADDLQEDGGRYYLYFSNLNARDFDETITFVILKDGVEVSRTLTYSVNSYIAKNGAANTADGNTLRALYCYGKSTESLSN